MKPALVVLSFVVPLLLLLLVPRAAHAHYVPGDPDPPGTTYVLVGPYFALGARACCSDREGVWFADGGAEVSMHRMLRGDSVFTQPGVGGYAQLTYGGGGDDLGPGSNVRLGLGGQLTLGPLGVNAGLAARSFSPRYGTSLAPVLGAFFSVGLFSAGVQVEAPITSLSNDRIAPTLVTIPITVKLPFQRKDDASR